MPVTPPPRGATENAEQLLLFKPPAKRGGARRGAGRKPKGLRAGASHRKRCELSGRDPIHVTLRVTSAVGNLRRRDAYRAIRAATLTTARRTQFRIVQMSIQRTHLHLLVEADDKSALAAGMQGFQISAARHLNAAMRKTQDAAPRRGGVFPDRYFAVVITSPRQARHALAYVLGNWRKHGEHREPQHHGWVIDWYSSADTFEGWREAAGGRIRWRRPPIYEPLAVHPPRTWMLRIGWQQHGLISCHEVPSATR